MPALLSAIFTWQAGGSSGSQRVAGSRGRSALTQPIDHPTISLRRSPGRTVTDESGRAGILRRWPRAAVDDALGGDRRPRAAGNDAGDLQDSITTIDANGDHVAHAYLGSRFGDGSIHRHVAGAARLRGDATGLEGAHRPQPAIHPGALHAQILSRAAVANRRTGTFGGPTVGRTYGRPAHRLGPATPDQRTRW
jgi:hypothetical protein